MIVRKPYAFLIKNFRIIHAFLLILIIFLASKTLNVYSFFSAYVSNRGMSSSEDVSSYITFTMYFIAALILAICALIYFILSLKNKDRKIYFYSIIYYIIMIFVFTILNSTFKSLSTETLDIESVRVYRDICLMAFLPQVALILIMFTRALGFNIKQFEFKKDLEEMDIEVTDSEEVELSMGSESYRIARFFRKSLRMIKYFVIENKEFVITLGSVIALILTFYAFKSFDVKVSRISENEQIYANSLFMTADESYITERDMSNSLIDKDRKYILVKVTLDNKSWNDISLDRSSFRLIVGEDMLFPEMSVNDKFNDMGKIFNGSTIKSGDTQTYIVIFYIESSNLRDNYIFRVKDPTINDYKDILIKPKDLDNVHDNGIYNLPAEVKFNNSLLKESSIIISGYEIADKFFEKYNYVVDGSNRQGTYTIIPSMKGRGSNTIIKVKTELKMDETITMSKRISKSSELMNYYGFVKYKVGDKEITSKMYSIDVEYATDKFAYAEIPMEAKNSPSLELILLIRGEKYTIILK